MRYKGLAILMAMLTGCFAPVNASEFDWLRATLAGVKAYQAYSHSDAEVVEYVKQAVKYMDQNNRVAPANSPYTTRLNRLTAGLKNVDGVPLNFKVYQTSEVNAFACADGSVRVYSGLMDLMTDNELLGVIGHEIGHVGKHHSRKAMKNELLTGALRDALASYDNKLGALADSQLGDLGTLMMNSKYSRTQENEADDYGYDFLKKSGKNPWGMAMALEKLQSISKQSSSATMRYISNMFSSHPDINSRVKRISDRCKKDGYNRPK